MTDGATTPAAPVRGGRTVLSDYLSVFGARGASVVIAAVSVVLTTQLLGTDGYGRLNYLLVVPFLVVSVGSAWSAAAVLTLGREELETEGTMGRTTWARVVTMAPVVLLAALGVVVARVAFGAYADYGWTLLLLVLAYSVLLIAAEHVVYLMQAAGRMKLSAVTQTLQRMLIVAGIAGLLVFAPDSGLTPFLLVSVVGGLIGTIYLGLVVGAQGFRPLRVDREYVRRLLAFSVPLIATTLGAFGIRWCDILVVKFYGSFDDVGRYALAYQGYENFLVLTVAAVSVFTPLVVSLKLAERLDVVRLYYGRAVPHALAISAVLLGIAAGPTHALVPVFFGQDFAGSADSFVVLYVALQFASAMSLLAAVLLGLSRTRAIALLTIVGVLINLGLDFALIPWLGIVGAAVATSTANLVMAVWMSISVSRAVDAPRAHLLMASLPLAAGLGLVLAFPGPVGYVAGPVAAAVTLVLLARFTRLVRADDAELLERLRVPERVRRVLEPGIRFAGR